MHIVLAKQGGDGKFKGSFNRSNLHFETLRSEGGNGSSSLKQQSKIMVLEFADDAVGLVSGVPFCQLLYPSPFPGSFLGLPLTNGRTYITL